MIMTALKNWQMIGIGVLLLTCAVLYGLLQGEKADFANYRVGIADALAESYKSAADIQKSVDAVSVKAADVQVVVQEKVVTVTKDIIKEIPRYVPDTTHCVTVGFIRVLYAAARGDSPEAIPLAPGLFDETCAGITARELATEVVESYGNARSNAAQLTGLQDWVRGTVAAIDAPPPD